MEGVPQLPMLSAPLKTTPEKSDFASKIRWQIREHFNEDPNSYVNEIRELESLRASACHPPIDFTGCALLKKYFCQLHFLQNRFTFEEGGHDEVIFPWNDIYTSMAYSTGDIKHEMACVLYNIGALHTVLGAMDNRQTADGMKMSCSHFQCAAWAFQHLNEKFPQLPETDLCHEIISFLMTVSLAQAQECILQKSIVDGRKAGIVAKVAVQIVEYYKSAQKILLIGNKNFDGNPVAEVVGSKIFKSWKKFCEFKLSYHQCVSLLYMGINCEELQKMGDRVAYFQLAMDKLAEATKLAKQVDRGGVDEAIQFAHDVVGGKLKAAEKENEFVYHEKVPEKTTLPEIKGASLVKGTPFDIKDPEVSGQDIFQRLVPMEAHEASSLYSEEKAKLLRRTGASIEEKDQELAMFLASLQLDQLKLHNEPQNLPQELIDRCAAFSVQSNAVGTLVEAMSKLSSVYTDVEAGLNEIQQLLDEEQDNERLFQSGQGKRPPSMILKELMLEASRYKDAHAKAAESNMLLHKAINSHLANLRTLSLPLSEIQAQLPSLQVLESHKDQAAIKELQRLLDKVDEMRKQRIMFYTQLRESLQADDITKLATHNSDHDALFAQELSKHQPRVSLIEQNLSAQENILKALTEANARYADTRRATTDIQHRRSATVAALLSSADAYPELLSKCEKGLEFYRKLETNVTKLLQRLRSVCRVQQEEREQQEAARMRPIKNDLRSVAPGELSGPRPERAAADSGNDGPKLRDFLHLMKKDRNTDGLPTGTSTVPSGSAAVPLNPIPVNQGPADTGSYSYPHHRPAPVGAEQNDPKACPNNGSSYVPHSQQDGTSKPYQYYHPSAYPAAYPGNPPAGPYGPAGYGMAYPTVDPSGYYAGSGYHSAMGQYPASTSASSSTTTPASSAPSGYGYYPQQYPPGPNPPLERNAVTTPSTIATSSSEAVTSSVSNQPTGTAPTSVGSAPTHPNYSPYSAATVPASSGAASYPIYPQMYPPTPAASVPVVASAEPQLQMNYQQMYTPSTSIPTTIPSAAYATSYPQPTYPIAPASSAPASSAAIQSYSSQAYSSTTAPVSAVSTTTVASHPAYTQPMYTPSNQQFPYGYGNATPQDPAVQQPTPYQINPLPDGYPYQYSPASGAAYGYPVMTPASTVSSSVSQAGATSSTAPYSYGTSSAVTTVSPSYQHAFANTSVAFGASTVTTAASGYDYYSTTSTISNQYYQYPYYGVNPQQQVTTGADPAAQAYYGSSQYGDFSAYASATPLQPQSNTHPAAGEPNPAVNATPAPEPAVPVGASHSAAVAPATEPVAPKPTSNLELLSLLDLSVPSGPSDPLLEPLSQSFGNRPWKDLNNTTNTVTTTKPKADANVEEKKVNVPAAISSPVELPIFPRPLTGPSSGAVGAAKDPLTDPEVSSKLASEVEKFDKLVDGLTRKSLNGPTPLDVKWKEVQEIQEKESAKRSISVARCYPMKNRFPDVLPYDHNRVELPTTKDDYINASQISALSSAGPSYIATQCPLPCTQQDFWTMLWQKQVEIIVCLLSDAEMKGSVYWPTEKGRDVTCGSWLISLQSANVRPNSVERILTLTKQGETKQNRVLIHLQFTAWPGSSFPPSPVQFLNFSAELLNFWRQQRNAAHPIVVHCLAGAGRTGLLCLICAALADLAAGHGIIDVVRVAAALCQQRRNMFRDREHLLFAYQAILYHAQDLLMKRGILCGKTSLQGSPAKVHHSRHPSQDFIQGIASPAPSVSPAPASIAAPLDDDVLDSAAETVNVKAEATEEASAEPTDREQEQQPSTESTPKKTGALAILDPANFTLDPTKSPPSSSASRIRVTKESFLSSKNSPQKIGTVADPNDPLSQLDPLWSLTK